MGNLDKFKDPQIALWCEGLYLLQEGETALHTQDKDKQAQAIKKIQDELAKLTPIQRKCVISAINIANMDVDAPEDWHPNAAKWHAVPKAFCETDAQGDLKSLSFYANVNNLKDSKTTPTLKIELEEQAKLQDDPKTTTEIKLANGVWRSVTVDPAKDNQVVSIVDSDGRCFILRNDDGTYTRYEVPDAKFQLEFVNVDMKDGSLTYYQWDKKAEHGFILHEHTEANGDVIAEGSDRTTFTAEKYTFKLEIHYDRADNGDYRKTVTQKANDIVKGTMEQTYAYKPDGSIQKKSDDPNNPDDK